MICQYLNTLPVYCQAMKLILSIQLIPFIAAPYFFYSVPPIRSLLLSLPSAFLFSSKGKNKPSFGLNQKRVYYRLMLPFITAACNPIQTPLFLLCSLLEDRINIHVPGYYIGSRLIGNTVAPANESVAVSCGRRELKVSTMFIGSGTCYGACEKVT